MEFRLARQISTPEANAVIQREVKKTDPYTTKLTKKNLAELAQVSKEIEEIGIPKHLVCKELPHDLGSGIFLHPQAKPLLKGSILAPYSGVVYFVPQNVPDDSCYAFAPLASVLLKKAEQQHFDPKRTFHPRRQYLMSLDALKEGNFTRFVNHCSKPNIVAHLVKVPKNTLGLATSHLEVIYFIKKTVQPGEQLLVSYEDGESSYWGVLGIEPFPMTPKTFQLDASLRLVSHVKKGK